MKYAGVLGVVALVFVWIVITAALGHDRLAVIGIGALGVVTCLLLLELRSVTSETVQRAADRDQHDLKRDEQVANLLEIARHIRRRDVPNVRSRLDQSAADVRAARDDLSAASQTLQQTISQTHQQLAEELDASHRRLDDEADRARQFRGYMRNQMRSLPRSLVQQIEAQQQLHERFEPTATFRAAGGWALAPTVTLEIVDLIARTAPALVLECGSGLSTVWLAYAIQEQGHGRVVALEHDEGYAEQTRTMLRRHGLETVAEVRHAPLQPTAVGGSEMLWYTAPMDDLGDIGVILVDGPPSTTGDDARYPAVPLLRERLVPDATIILDDITRPDERAILNRWLDEDETLELDTELPGGAVLLRAR